MRTGSSGGSNNNINIVRSTKSACIQSIFAHITATYYSRRITVLVESAYTFYRVVWFFSERELTFTFAICCRPSVCRLSVTLVLHIQPVEILGNFSTPFGTVDIHGKFCGDRPRGPSIGGGKRKRGSQIQRFWTYRRLYMGNGARQEVSQYQSLIESRIVHELSTGTKIGDLE